MIMLVTLLVIMLLRLLLLRLLLLHATAAVTAIIVLLPKVHSPAGPEPSERADSEQVPARSSGTRCSVRKTDDSYNFSGRIIPPESRVRNSG